MRRVLAQKYHDYATSKSQLQGETTPTFIPASRRKLAFDEYGVLNEDVATGDATYRYARVGGVEGSLRHEKRRRLNECGSQAPPPFSPLLRLCSV